VDVRLVAQELGFATFWKEAFAGPRGGYASMRS
jgi:hypothetical protein